MIIHLGPPPEDPSFDPLAQGWQAIREPGPLLVQIFAIPVAGAIVIGQTALILWVGGSNPFPLLLSVRAIFLFLALIPLHEMLHLLAHPGFGLTPSSILGIWPSRAVIYTAYLESMPRRRFMAALAMPLAGLSLLPFLLLALGRLIAIDETFIEWLALISLVNGVASSGDLIGLALIGFQTPRGALIRDKGWRSYWRK